jgi:hypothetical protein
MISELSKLFDVDVIVLGTDEPLKLGGVPGPLPSNRRGNLALHLEARAASPAKSSILADRMIELRTFHWKGFRNKMEKSD